MKTNHEIILGEVKLNINGIAYQGEAGTREQPPESPSFEIQTIEIQGEDITALVDEIAELKTRYKDLIKKGIDIDLLFISVPENAEDKIYQIIYENQY